MHKILLVVDMQNDFITGALGTPEAKAILPKVKEKVKQALSEGTQVFYTQDTHHKDYLSTQEGRNLPIPHCVEGQDGWGLPPSLEGLLRDSAGYTKNTFGSKELVADLVQLHDQNPFGEIEICGLCTDICVISNALLIKAFLPEVPIVVNSDYCAGVTPEGHETALAAMKACQVDIRKG